MSEPGLVDQFLALREKSGCPVVIVKLYNEFIERLNPHQLELSRSSLNLWLDDEE